jgi:type I restriction enzyme S subunit
MTLFGLSQASSQRPILVKVEQLMALVDALKTQLAASRTTATKLLEAVASELTSSVNPVAP